MVVVGCSGEEVRSECARRKADRVRARALRLNYVEVARGTTQFPRLCLAKFSKRIRKDTGLSLFNFLSLDSARSFKSPEPSDIMELRTHVARSEGAFGQLIHLLRKHCPVYRLIDTNNDFLHVLNDSIINLSFQITLTTSRLPIM